MLVEIPDLEVILNGIAVFIGGIIALFAYYKIKPYINFKEKALNSAYLERLEYYDKQFIDMKIRLDAINLGTEQVVEPKIVEKEDNLDENSSPEAPKETQASQSRSKAPPVILKRMPNLGYSDVIGHILRLIVDKPMTSRDIQVTIGRTREHTSRLMKRLHADGFVQRNTTNRPYTYSITSKGHQRLDAPTTA